MENTVNEKKTLMLALDSLDVRYAQLRGIVELSELLVKKFENPRGELKDNQEKAENSPKERDLIDMFIGLSEGMENRINTIGTNLEHVLRKID